MTAPDGAAWNLESILAPLPLDTFMEEIYGKRYHVHSHGSARFAGILPWEDAAELAMGGTVMPPRMSLSNGPKTIAAGNYGSLKGKWRAFSPDPLRYSEYLNQSATIAVHQIDALRTSIAEIAGDLEHRLAVTVTCEAYASFHEQHAFITHWDPADVLVMQIHGRKYWRIWEPTRHRPHEVDTEWPSAPVGDPIWEGVLEEGDILYLPHGFWHDVVATSQGPSLHISFFMTKPSGIDVLTWLAEAALDHDIFRQELPVFEDEAAQVAYGKRLAEAAQDLWTSDVVSKFLDARAGIAEPRPRINLPWDAYPPRAPEDDTVQLRGTPPLPVRIRDEDGAVVFDALGKTWSFAPEARGMLELVVDRRPHTVSEWYVAAEPMPGDRVRTFIAELIREGLLQANRY